MLETTSGAPAAGLRVDLDRARRARRRGPRRSATSPPTRALEPELRKTKEFLERLIDSTVDAIIAADFTGQIILFNQGAERLFGYRADDVIGKIRVWRPLPERAARARSCAMLRSTAYGGVGRLEQTRREVRRARRRARPGQHDRIDRLRGRARGRDRRHPHRPARAHPHRAAPARGAGEAPRHREAGAHRRARRRRRPRAQPAAHVGHGLRAADQAQMSPDDAAPTAPSASSCARPSAWPRSSRRSARSRVRDQGLRRLDADPRPREVDRPMGERGRKRGDAKRAGEAGEAAAAALRDARAADARAS